MLKSRLQSAPRHPRWTLSTPQTKVLGWCHYQNLLSGRLSIAHYNIVITLTLTTTAQRTVGVSACCSTASVSDGQVRKWWHASMHANYK